MKLISLLLTVSLLAASSISAKNQPKFEALAEVKGVVCSFCVYGLQKNLARLEFIDKNHYKKGVLVDIKKGHISLALDPKAPIEFEQIEKGISKGGYKLVGVHLELEGVVSRKKGKSILLHAANDQQFALVNSKGKPWTPDQASEDTLSVHGFVTARSIKRSSKDGIIRFQVTSAQKNPAKKKSKLTKMPCKRCATRLQSQLSKTKGVIKARVNWKKKTVQVELEKGTPKTEIKATIEEAGFKPVFK